MGYNVDFLKIDVESREAEVFRGMAELMNKPMCPMIIYEAINSTGIQPTMELIEILKEFGYKAYLIDNKQLVEIRPEYLEITLICDHLAVNSFQS